MSIWQVTCYGVYTSEGWPKSVKASRTLLGSCAKISKTQHQNEELPQMPSQNYIQLFHLLPSCSCSCMHITRILFQGHSWVSLERNERTKSQRALQAEAKLTRRGNYQWKRWGITAPKGTSINLTRVIEQSLGCWAGFKEPLAQKWQS